MDKTDTGLLLNPTNIKLHRQYFKEMVRLIGINVQYRAPREDKHYSGYGELDSFFYEPITIGAIYDEHPSQKTMKKLGWNAELQKEPIIISVPYDTPKVQSGALIELPSGLDGAESRLFRILRMSNISIYPASITCEIGPMWANTMEKDEVDNFQKSNFNLLSEEEED